MSPVANHLTSAMPRLRILLVILVSIHTASKAQVTAIYSDYGGYWTSSSTSINPVKPDNSHNMLGFTWNGTTFSTGVNDAALTSHSVSFTPLSFRAFPVNSVPNTAGGYYFVMLGQLYDGINNGVDNNGTSPFPANPTGQQLAGFLTDGTKGLNLGTGLANIPAGTVLRFDLSANGISLSAINDGKPDIFVTEEASPSSSSPDIFEFVDIHGNIVGNAVSVTTSSLPQVANWQTDFYDLTSQQTDATYIDQPRPMAFYAADLGTFGITSSNYMNAVALLYEPNGTSDPAFLAFSEPSISVATQLIIAAQPGSYQDNVTLSPSPLIQIQDGLGQSILQSGVPVTASIQSGSGTLTGTVTVNTDASGVADFSNLQITGSSNVTLQFSSASLNAATSQSILYNSSPLPLTWIGFTAQKQGDGVELKWQTAYEANTLDFEVQRSPDASNWATIGTLSAAGNSNTTTNYSYSDQAPGNGINYYHILQRNIDGGGSYSKVVSVSLSGNGSGVRVFPNPVVNGQLTIVLPEAATVRLFNSTGGQVFQQKLPAGARILNIGGLTKGIYQLTADGATVAIAVP